MTPEPNAKVFRGDDGQWYFRVQAANGQIVSQSEGYASRSNAERGLKTALETAADVLLDERGD